MLKLRMSSLLIAGVEINILSNPAAIAASMGVAAKTIESQAQLTKELSEPVKGLSIVVVSVPNREGNADFLKGIYNSVASM